MNENFNDDDTDINLDDFAVTSQDRYVTFDDLDLLSRDIDDTEEFIIPTNFITTTNSGDIAVKVQEKFKYGFKFSSCNILNNVGSLIMRQQNDIKGNRYVNHRMKKLCYVAKFQSIPLLFPKGIMFPSLHWKSTNYKCSIVGTIPSLLLNSCCILEGFSSIQQHINSKLTFHSNDMGLIIDISVIVVI